MQKKRWILPVIMLAIAVIAAAVGLWNYLRCITEAEAFQIASDYIVEQGLAPQGTKFVLEESLLTCDIRRLVTGEQVWIQHVNWPNASVQGQWVYMDAHTGKVTGMVQGFQEWWTPIAIPNLHNMFSVLSAALYALTVLFSFFYWKRNIFKVLFWIFLVLSCGYAVLYAVGAVVALFFMLLAW